MYVFSAWIFILSCLSFFFPEIWYLLKFIHFFHFENSHFFGGGCQVKHLDPDLDNLYNRAQATLNQPQPGRAQEPGIGREFFFEHFLRSFEWPGHLKMQREWAKRRDISTFPIKIDICTYIWLYMNLYDICKRFCHISSECTSKFFVT